MPVDSQLSRRVVDLLVADGVAQGAPVPMVFGPGAQHVGAFAAGPPAGDPSIAHLEKLAELHHRGILTDEKFAAQKAKILGGF